MSVKRALVTPAKAGVQTTQVERSADAVWIPAFAGMTEANQVPRAGGPARGLLPCRGSGRGNGSAGAAPHRRRALCHFPASRLVAPASLLLLAACATQTGAAVETGAPGFWLGLWHGFIFPVAWVLSLFMPDVSVYQVPNNGGWYDFGYFLGIVVFGVGARKSQVVYRDRIVRR